MKLLILKTLAFAAGIFTCHLLQTEAQLTPALAAALTGFVGSFLHFPALYEKKGLHSAIYAGSFAGMCSPEIFNHPFEFLVLSLFAAGVYLLTIPHVTGFGGKLGTVSFIASILFFLLRNAW